MSDHAMTAAHEISQAMDDYLLSFFGSRENAARFAHMYTLESDPIETSGDGPTLSASQRFRLRLKDEYKVVE